MRYQPLATIVSVGEKLQRTEEAIPHISFRQTRQYLHKERKGTAISIR